MEVNKLHKEDNKIVIDGVECLESHTIKEIPYREDDSYLKVTDVNENRLDKIAYEYYGSTKLWWVIAEASGILNPLDVPIDTILRIPTLSSLYLLQGIKL